MSEPTVSNANNGDTNKLSSKWAYFLGFGALLVGFYAFYTTKAFEDLVLLPYVGAQTKVVSALLNLFGAGTAAEGVMLRGPGIPLNVAKGCDGIEVTFMYLAGVLLMPFSWRSKMVGAFWGLGVLIALNILRVILLYVAQMRWPSTFDFLHLHGGFALFSVVAILMWVAWTNWAMKQEPKAATAS